MPACGLRRYRFRTDFSRPVRRSVRGSGRPAGFDCLRRIGGTGSCGGLYASSGPLPVYALFGTSPQLMVNPDAASCAILAVAVTPLAGGDPALYLPLATALTSPPERRVFWRGLLAWSPGGFPLRPILVGFLNGIALSIFLGQIGKVLGFEITASRITRGCSRSSRVASTHAHPLCGPVQRGRAVAGAAIPGAGTRCSAAGADGSAGQNLFNLQSLGVAALFCVPQVCQYRRCRWCPWTPSRNCWTGGRTGAGVVHQRHHHLPQLCRRGGYEWMWTESWSPMEPPTSRPPCRGCRHRQTPGRPAARPPVAERRSPNLRLRPPSPWCWCC